MTQLAVIHDNYWVFKHSIFNALATYLLYYLFLVIKMPMTVKQTIGIDNF